MPHTVSIVNEETGYLRENGKFWDATTGENAWAFLALIREINKDRRRLSTLEREVDRLRGRVL